MEIRYVAISPTSIRITSDRFILVNDETDYLVKPLTLKYVQFRSGIEDLYEVAAQTQKIEDPLIIVGTMVSIGQGRFDLEYPNGEPRSEQFRVSYQQIDGELTAKQREAGIMTLRPIKPFLQID